MDIALISSGSGELDYLLKLPDEILLSIFSFPEKKDLKSIRACSKRCYSLVTGLLFDKIFISPHQKDLDIFTHITNHPLIRKTVRHLIYGVARFEAEFSLSDYRRLLLTQTALRVNRIYFTLYFSEYDEQAQIFLKIAREVRNADLENVEEMSAAMTARPNFLLEGFEQYKRIAIEQNENMRNGELEARLLSGLPRLPLLRTFSLKDEWSSHPCREIGADISVSGEHCPSGSPLVRSYSLLYLIPESFGGEVRSNEFSNILHALALARTKTEAFNMSARRSLEHLMYDPNTHMNLIPLHDTINAFAHLHSLELYLFRNDYYFGSNLQVLPQVLQSITNLRSVYVNLDQERYDSRGNPLDLSNIFGASFTWPHLSSITLERLWCSQDQLINLLRTQPRLRSLCLQHLGLAKGVWEDVFDDLYNFLHLEIFSLWTQRQLSVYVEDDSWEWGYGDYQAATEAYVLYGGCNPLRTSICLPCKDSPDEVHP